MRGEKNKHQCDPTQEENQRSRRNSEPRVFSNFVFPVPCDKGQDEQQD